MKAHLAVVLVVDFDDIGAEATKHTLERSVRHSQFYPAVVGIDTTDIGEWDDDNPLNHSSQREEAVRRLFPRFDAEALSDELNCAEETVDAIVADFVSESDERFHNGFDCMGDYLMALWEVLKEQREVHKAEIEALHNRYNP